MYFCSTSLITSQICNTNVFLNRITLVIIHILMCREFLNPSLDTRCYRSLVGIFIELAQLKRSHFLMHSVHEYVHIMCDMA